MLLEKLEMLKIVKNKVSAFIVSTCFLVFGNKIDKTTSLINKFFVFNGYSEQKVKDIKIDKIKKRLTYYPSYGEAFGSLEIPSVSIDVALYHGESLSVLKYGLGHHAGSLFPGEGGTIIIAGHNTYGFFYKLPQVKVGDVVIIKTVYGTYHYEVTSTDIAEASVLGHNLKISHDEETVMLYTCYPVETPGYKSKRFVVYGRLVGEDNE